MEKQLSVELGIGEELDKAGGISALQKARGFEKEMVVTHKGLAWDTKKPTGDILKDGLNSAKRGKLYSMHMGRVRELFKRGKVEEARSEFDKTVTALQKFDDDLKYYEESVQQYWNVGIKE